MQSCVCVCAMLRYAELLYATVRCSIVGDGAAAIVWALEARRACRLRVRSKEVGECARTPTHTPNAP